jgi:hypothetical protein
VEGSFSDGVYIISITWTLLRFWRVILAKTLSVCNTRDKNGTMEKKNALESRAKYV